MKQIDMKFLRKSAALLPLVALPVVATPACAQQPLLEDDTRTYRVVINHEEQYSIWPIDREVPTGWKKEGTVGTKQQCLDRIEEVWTDMRPLSLRKQMERDERSG